MFYVSRALLSYVLLSHAFFSSINFQNIDGKQKHSHTIAPLLLIFSYIKIQVELRIFLWMSCRKFDFENEIQSCHLFEQVHLTRTNSTLSYHRLQDTYRMVNKIMKRTKLSAWLHSSVMIVFLRHFNDNFSQFKSSTGINYPLPSLHLILNIFKRF